MDFVLVAIKVEGGNYVRGGCSERIIAGGIISGGNFVRAPLGADPGFLDPWRTMGRLLTSMGRQMDFRV